MLTPSAMFATPRTVARQAPLSVEFARQERWSRLPFPLPGDLPKPGAEPTFPALQVNSLLPSLRGSLPSLGALLRVSFSRVFS